MEGILFRYSIVIEMINPPPGFPAIIPLNSPAFEFSTQLGAKYSLDHAAKVVTGDTEDRVSIQSNG